MVFLLWYGTPDQPHKSKKKYEGRNFITLLEGNVLHTTKKNQDIKVVK